MDVPEELGGFRIEDRLGYGGMGVVYRAREINSGRMCALKLIGESLPTTSAIGRFQRETEALLRLDHPNIARLQSFGQDKGYVYLCMELIDGVTLREVLDELTLSEFDTSIDQIIARSTETRNESMQVDLTTIVYDQPEQEIRPERAVALKRSRIENPLHVRRCGELALSLADALQHAHQHQVIHRDLKPANIMLDKNGDVRLIDFGLAKVVDEISLTQTGDFLGTPMYMSPEQVSGRIGLDARTDIYALGLILYELLTLTHPARGESRKDVLRNILLKPVPPVNWLNKEVSAPLASVVHQATAKDPDDRYPDIAAMREDLTVALRGGKVSAPPYQFRFDTSEITRNRPLPTSILGLVYLFIVVVLAGVSAYYFYDHYDKLSRMPTSEYVTDKLWKEFLLASAFPLVAALFGAVFLLAQRHLMSARLWPIPLGYGFLGLVGFFTYGQTGNSAIDSYCLFAGAILVGLLIWNFGPAGHRRWYRDARQIRWEYRSIRKQCR
ncbi:MAG TPA: bifunctional serine/threonine protein kinase/MFS transporter [Planctomycetaceae bacterium]|nr:bifunctional serine/threonine protein kinase/MFS transporter [Planctomycetaceae bacterium]